FDIIKKESLTGIEQRLSDPQALAQNALQRTLQPYPKTDIRYVPTLPEERDRMQKANLDDVKRIYKTFVGASYSQATYVGDFDPAELKEALDKGLGKWKSPKPWKRIDLKYQKVAGKLEKIDTPDKEGGFIALGANLDLRDDDPGYPALYMTGFLLGT